jgi:PAS domain-containing protein
VAIVETKANELQGTTELAALRPAWQSILNAAPVAGYTCDTAGRITYFNAPATAAWGRTPQLRHRADRYCGSLRMYAANGAPIPHDECWMALALRHGRAFNGREVVIERPNGSLLKCLAYANPVRDLNTHVIGAVNLVVDLAPLGTLNTDRAAAASVAARLKGDTLAIIEVALAVLAGLSWPAAAFA